MKNALSQVLKHTVTAIATAKDYIYAGDSEGRLQVSADAGITWGNGVEAGRFGQSGSHLGGCERSSRGRGGFERAQRARAILPKPTYVLRTMNGGVFWDDITANLPDNASAHGVTADRASGAIYVATDAGVFFTATDLASAGRPHHLDVAQREPACGGGHRREIGRGRQPDLCGAGWLRSLHRHRSASFARCAGGERGGLQRPAGGARRTAERAGGARGIGHQRRCRGAGAGCLRHRVADPGAFFGHRKYGVVVADCSTGRAYCFEVPSRSVSPAIFVDPEGTPLIMDAASGVLLDSSKPAHASSRIQVLATGLGQVRPDWPTGLAGAVEGSAARGCHSARLSGRTRRWR